MSKVVLMLVALVALVCLVGCASVVETKRYEVKKPFSIFVWNQEEFRDEVARTGKPVFTMGWNNRTFRLIHVQASGDFDINGQPLPDFYTLGYEIWSNKELGGDWYEQKPR